MWLIDQKLNESYIFLTEEKNDALLSLIYSAEMLEIAF